MEKTKAQEIIDNINRLKEEQQKALDQLACSLAIQKLWPSVKWPAKSGIYNDPQTKEPKFFIKSNTGDFKYFSLPDMPSVFIERPHIQKAILHLLKHKHINPKERQRYKNLMTNNPQRKEAKSL